MIILDKATFWFFIGLAFLAGLASGIGYLTAFELLK